MNNMNINIIKPPIIRTHTEVQAQASTMFHLPPIPPAQSQKQQLQQAKQQQGSIPPAQSAWHPAAHPPINQVAYQQAMAMNYAAWMMTSSQQQQQRMMMMSGTPQNNVTPTYGVLGVNASTPIGSATGVMTANGSHGSSGNNNGGNGKMRSQSSVISKPVATAVSRKQHSAPSSLASSISSSLSSSSKKATGLSAPAPISSSTVNVAVVTVDQVKTKQHPLRKSPRTTLKEPLHNNGDCNENENNAFSQREVSFLISSATFSTPLPTKSVHLLVEFLDNEDLLNASLVNKEWYRVQECLWK